METWTARERTGRRGVCAREGFARGVLELEHRNALDTCFREQWPSHPTAPPSRSGFVVGGRTQVWVEDHIYSVFV